MSESPRDGRSGGGAPAAADPHRLQRFVEAQDGVWPQVLAELSAGAKTSHWMWFVFPQLKALGRSATARHFGIDSLAEASAYADHAVLGPRLRACCHLLLQATGRPVEAIFGAVDAMKQRSSMTLFERAVPDDPVFGQVLEAFHAGRRDEATEALLVR